MSLAFVEEDILSSICRESFKTFVKEFWEEIPGSGNLIWNWHMDIVCQELQEIAERVFKNQPKSYDLIINISPGMSKSSVASILFPAWTWTRMPSARHITASHTDTLCLDLSNKSRFVITSDKYRSCFPNIEIREDQDTKGYFANTAGGDRLTCTIGGKTPTGFHAHFLTIDDPIDPKKALSEQELRISNFFFDSVIPSRKVDKQVSVMSLIMQRLHEDDPTGHIKNRPEEAGKIRHICLPAEKTEDINPPELSQFYVNDLMDPVRLSKKVLDTEKIIMGNYAYAGQYLQRPVPLGGGMFKEHFFNRRVKAAPYNAKRIRYWDRASSIDPDACLTAGVLMAKDEKGNYFVEHVVNGKWEPDERNEVMQATALRDRNKYGPSSEPIIYVEAEGGSSGRDAWKGVARALAGFVVREDRPTGKKEVRAEPWACQCAAGNVYLVEDGTWNINTYISHHTSFPMGKYKDNIDASSGAFNLLVKGRLAGSVRVYNTRNKKGNCKFYVCSKEELQNTIIENKGILINFRDYGEQEEKPLHAVTKLLDWISLSFADLEPANYQDKWDDLVEPYGKKVEEIVINREIGKRLWFFLLKKRDPLPEIFIFQSNQDDKKAVSAACAVCDILHYDKNTSIFLASNPDNKLEEMPLNKYIYDVVKMSRNLVVM